MRFHPMTGRNLKSGSLYELNFQGSQFRGTLEEPSTGLQRLRVLATGCFLEAHLQGLTCLSAAVHGGAQLALTSRFLIRMGARERSISRFLRRRFPELRRFSQREISL